MNIDERLEALTQTVELLAAMHKESEVRLAASSEQTDQRFAETDRRFAEVARLFAETHEFINSLAHVAEAHENRIDDLEKR